MLRKSKIASVFVLLMMFIGIVYADIESVLNFISINPNPVEKSTIITLSFLQKVNADVVIESEDGIKIKTLFTGDLNSGIYEFFWNRLSDTGEFVPEGQYNLVVHFDTRYTSTKKTIILK